MNPRMRPLMAMAALQSAGEFAAWGFFFLFAHGLGYGLPQLALLSGAMFGGALAALFIIPRLDRYTAFRAGLALKAAVFLGFATPWAFWLAPALAFALGFSLIIYWVPYNIVFMDELEDRDRATWSSAMFMSISVMNVVVPILAGLAVDRWGFPPIFAAGALLTLVPVFAVDLEGSPGRRDSGSPGRRDSPDPRPRSRTGEGEGRTIHLRSLKYMRRTRHLMLPITLEGMWDGTVRTALPIMAIAVVDTAGEYGLVLAVFGLGGSAAALVTARFSDRSLRRGGPILAASAMGAGSIAAAGVVWEPWMWVICAGLVYFALMVTLPFNFTVARELSTDSTDSMVAREVYLNCGRVLGIMLAALFAALPVLPGMPGRFTPALLVGAAACAFMGAVFARRLKQSRVG